MGITHKSPCGDKSPNCCKWKLREVLASFPADRPRRTETDSRLTDMDTAIVVVLLSCFLLPALVIPAPTPGPPLTVRQAVEQAQTVVEKILADVATTHASTITASGLTFDPNEQRLNLEVMREKLDIPPAPVIEPLSEDFKLDMCVSRLLAGIRLHQELLGLLSNKVTGLKGLNNDLRDLLLCFNKMKQVGQLGGADSSDQNSSSDLAARLDADFDVQVAVHLTLAQLRSFCHDMIRSLRNIKAAHRALSPRP